MPLDHDAIIEAEGAALADAAEQAAPDAPVPGTDWTLTDLLDHVGRLTFYWAGRARTAGGGEFYDLERPDGTDRVAWFRSGLDAMRRELAAADDDAEVKTWAGLKPPAWLWRRMAHELAVHRYDAEGAAGDPAPIDTEVAADGVDEFLQEFVGTWGVEGFGEPATLHLHATDDSPNGAAGEWFIDVGSDTVTWERAHAKGDVAVRGTTSDLLLLLWGRVPADAVEVLGDADVLARWRSATSY
jgi:uncharacterized protein (TIGR03083 family)